jgi:hypothetical protein
VAVTLPPTKFYVIDPTLDNTFEYSPTGQALTNYSLNSANKNARDVTTKADGSKVWVINDDKSDEVFVYNDAGTSLGRWTAKNMSGKNLTTPEGIATNGTDIWIVDDGTDTVFQYANAAGLTGGSMNASSSFTLVNNGLNINRSPKGITTDGTHLWVVDNSATDRVFKYTVSGAFVGAWTLSTPSVSTPTGITIDPAEVNHIWIVDSGTDKVYQYSGATGRISGTQAADTIFALAAGNTDPQGIADPRALIKGIAVPEASNFLRYHNALNGSDVNNDGVVSPLDALLIINQLNLGRDRVSSSQATFEDVNGDGSITPLDALLVINVLNDSSFAQRAAARAASQQIFAELGDSEDGTQAAVFASIDDILKRKTV